MIGRAVVTMIHDFFDFQKAVIIKGARQVGKSTLINELLEGRENILWIDGDDPQARETWDSITKANIMLYTEGYDYIVFDEAQRIENIGLTVKMILDQRLNKQIIISGSSSLDLSSTIYEPLTGRKWTFELFPFSWRELVDEYKLLPARDQLDAMLIYGTYPEVFLAKTHKERRLRELTTSYLYKDILEVGQVRKPEIIVNLLKALAYQVGSPVSYNELGNMLQIDNETIKRYIGLLEDNYVIFRLEPYSTNPRKELSKSRKIYFYDNGVRNALINNFRPLSDRNDIGNLWENYIVSELRKKHSYDQTNAELKFWRSKSGSEIDLLAIIGEDIYATEIKYSAKKRGTFPKSFRETYLPKEMTTINHGNFYEHL